VASICDEAERLERLVSNLLDMTKLDSGAIRLRREWVPAEEPIGSALVRLERKLGGRAVETSIAEGTPLLHVDVTLLEQLLYNLLENAAKHTPPTATKRRSSSASIAGILRRPPVWGSGCRSAEPSRRCTTGRWWRGTSRAAAPPSFFDCLARRHRRRSRLDRTDLRP
jgi:hypothetical protein